MEDEYSPFVLTRLSSVKCTIVNPRRYYTSVATRRAARAMLLEPGNSGHARHRE